MSSLRKVGVKQKASSTAGSPGSQTAKVVPPKRRCYRMEDYYRHLYFRSQRTVEKLQDQLRNHEETHVHLRKEIVKLNRKLKASNLRLETTKELLKRIKITWGVCEGVQMPKDTTNRTSAGKKDAIELEGGGGDKMGEDEQLKSNAKVAGKSGEGKGVIMEELNASGGDEDAGDEGEGFIRIRSQDDGIFEQEDDDEDDDEYFEFPMPEVEIKEQAGAASRKRKQEISYMARDDLDDLVEISDEEYLEQYFQPEQYLTNTGVLRKRSKEQRFQPLYMLNPDDYAHDQKKQVQIKRAIITYRHHKEKKETILRQKEEIKQLRIHNDALKAKVLELSGCGCEKNSSVDLEVVDVMIPSVPMRLYLKGNRSGVGSAINSASQSAGNTPKSSSSGKPLPQTNLTTSSSSSTKISSVEETKPLVNITSSRLANLNSKTMATATTRPLNPPVNKPLLNSNVALRSRFASPKYFIKQGNGKSLPENTTFIPVASLKSEPGSGPISVSLLDDRNRGTMITRTLTTTADNGMPMRLNAVKVKSTSPATAAPASRIVFARKGATNSNAIQTASQILFGTKTMPSGAQFISNNTNITANSVSRPLTASQIALASRNSMTNQSMNSPLNPVNRIVRPPTQQSQSQVFRTASGQILQLVQSVPSARVATTSSVGRGRRAPNFLPIKPKPTPELHSLDEEIRRRNTAKKSMEEMWQQLDDNEDEMAIIEAITGTSPTQQQRNRKQTITNRPNSQDNVPSSSNSLYSKKVIEVDGSNIELQRYADVVFEEAD